MTPILADHQHTLLAWVYRLPNQKVALQEGARVVTRIVLINGSPSEPSKTEQLLHYVERRLHAEGHDTWMLNVRSLPCQALMHGDYTDVALAAAIEHVGSAGAIVIGTPVYKASYSGLLKTFVDVLPQRAFAGLPVLPLVTGASPAHVLALDHGLKPLLSTLGATSIAAGRFVNSDHISSAGVAEEVRENMNRVVDDFLTDIQIRQLPPSPTRAALPSAHKARPALVS